MKTSILSVAAAGLFVLAGCSTPNSMSKAEGHGEKRIYKVDYDTMYAASHAAAQMDELEVVGADPDAGYICSHRMISADSFGENIGIWVRKISPTQTEVEVVSRANGPLLRTAHQREDKILKRIAMLLSY